MTPSSAASSSHTRSAPERDGGIVVAGEGDCRYAGCFVLARYRPDGSLDPGFGEGGVVRTPFGLLHGAQAFDVSIMPDGRIVAAGFVQKGGDGKDSSYFAVARYLPDGRLDQSFSRDGRARVDSATAPTSPTPSRTSPAGGSSWPARAR